MTISLLRYWAVVALAVVLLDGCSKKSGPVTQSSHGLVEIGKQMPSFSFVSETGVHYHSREPWTNLSIYSIAAEHPPVAVDEGDKIMSASARKIGSRVFRMSDGKVAKIFGMKMLEGKQVRYDTSMIAIADKNCTVLGIWTAATLDDLDVLLKQLEAKRPANSN